MLLTPKLFKKQFGSQNNVILKKSNLRKNSKSKSSERFVLTIPYAGLLHCMLGCTPCGLQWNLTSTVKPHSRCFLQLFLHLQVNIEICFKLITKLKAYNQPRLSSSQKTWTCSVCSWRQIWPVVTLKEYAISSGR